MSFDDHDRCRRCGAGDTASHTTAECDRILRERAEAQRRHDATHGAARCGFGKVCGWMRAAIDEPRAAGVSFIRREMEDPNTLRPVVRFVAMIGGDRQTVIRACPACGGDPNGEETTTR